MDAPLHFYNGVPTIDQVPLEQCIGPAVLIDVSSLGPRGEVHPDHLRASEASIRSIPKVVLRTGWSGRWGHADYFLDYPVISEAAAEWLISRSVHLIGLDTPSVDREPNPAHYAILGAHAVIVENLTNLEQITQSPFELIVQPLPLRGLDGSPVRAVARVSS
jgi:kynurenine formamidase